jgi:2',3'-cyclic-nucleotide 2'-phosphodiesterase (5'-nucleotidase family)
VPGVDVLVVGMEGSVDQTVEKVGDTAVVQNAERGRFASSLGVTLGKDNTPASYSLRTIPLDDKITDDPDMTRLVQGYRQRLAAVPTGTPPANFVPGR